MSKIKVSELFYSIQGEGRYMGVPSIFLRTFGCNFRCQGFGMDRGQLSNEVQFIDPAQYRIYHDLPLVSTGCDSYGAIYPEFKHLSPMVETAELAEKIVDLLPFKEWRNEHLVITGGEPLLGWQRAYPELLDHPVMQTCKEITFETNGTQALTADFKQFLQENFDRNDITFSVSAKLPCSGEPWNVAIRPELVVDYQTVGHTYLKFVIATEEDFEDAKRAIGEYQAAGFTGDIYLMPVGGVESVYAMNNRTVADLAMKNGLRYSDRLQVPLFGNAWST